MSKSPLSYKSLFLYKNLPAYKSRPLPFKNNLKRNRWCRIFTRKCVFSQTNANFPHFVKKFNSPTWNELVCSSSLALVAGVAGWRLKPARKGRGRLALDPSTSALCAYAQDDTLGKAEARGRLSPPNPFGAFKTYLERFFMRVSATFGA